jgi:Zn-dependent metalloprotease
MKAKLLNLLLLITIFIHQSVSQEANDSELKSFLNKTGGKPSYSKATGNLNFMRFPKSKAFLMPKGKSSEKMLSFLQENVGIFSTKKNADKFQLKTENKDKFGLEHATSQQYYKGVPVFDGLLNFHFDREGNLASFNGNYIDIDKLNPVPTISKEFAEAAALKEVDGNDYQITGFPLYVKSSELLIFQKGLVQGYNGSKHLAYKVEVTNDKNVREFVFVDAHTKEIVEQFTGIHDALDRSLYNGSYNTSLPATNLIWKEGDVLPGTLDIWQQAEVETAGQMYNLMKNAFGFISYNGMDAPMITVHDDPTINCPNANWNGQTANFCTGIASDDVVAHEWGHAYTEYTNNLIYAWQAGALNESYSDIWGETVDQLNNGYFDTGETNLVRTINCADSDRWKLGEATSGGVNRDMYNPNCDGRSPGRVLDPMYWCSTADNGGVHINSGVHNHAYALLVDGGTYNGQTINGIGLTKAAHIFWFAQKNYVIATTNFKDQADNLEDALIQLIGIDLPALSTANGASTLSGIVITESDLVELQKVLLAVEMRVDNKCGFTPLLKPVDTICSGGSPTNSVYFEDFEDGLTSWTTTNSGGIGWISHDWIATTNLPQNRNGKVAFAINDAAGSCGPDFSGVLSIESPLITVPLSITGPLNLAFDHYISAENRYDGGNLKYSINGGEFLLVPTVAFLNNGYNSILFSSASQNTNPMAGQPAFTGADNGSIQGTWGQSRINLTSLGLEPGENIKFRWDFGQDGCAGWIGWYIDDVRLYSCALPSVQFVSKTTVVNEAEAIVSNTSPNECLSYIEKFIKIKINKAPSQPVTVTFNSPLGTATQGATADYSINPMSFQLDETTLEKDVLIRIYNDAIVEGNEDFTLAYTLSGGSDAFPETFNQTHSITITDNDLEPGIIQTQLLFENFETGTPIGWQTLTSAGLPEAVQFSYPSSWGLNTLRARVDATRPRKLIADSDASITEFNKIVESPPFNTIGANNITLSFFEYFRIYDGADDAFEEKGTVQVWDGANWQTLLTHLEAEGSVGSATNPFNRQIEIPASYANAAMKIRFQYHAKFDYYWIIDNVKIVAGLPTQVLSAVNTAKPAQAYLGPLQTAVFYDPTSGDLIAKIKNLSNHDYGCTTVEIDRSGIGQMPWVGVYKISAKTFKVTPANNNPNGTYEITFYYKAAEIAGTVINSMGKSNGSIVAGATGLYAGGQSGSVFNADYSYTATFNSGFSGFGLSDALPGAALPVELIAFEGVNINEGNQLTWITAEEKNNEAFLIERSDNAKDFKTISKIVGKGNSNEKNVYSYLDATAFGVNYYRLKQFDIDGKYGYSNVISIQSKSEGRISFSPNPVNDFLTIAFPKNFTGNLELKIMNSIGAEVQNRQMKITDGKISQDMSHFAPGVYFISIKVNNSISNYKIIKQ